MRKIKILCVMLVITSSLNAQIVTPVHWSFAAKMIGKNSAVVFIKATIDQGWHVYSTKQKDGGPVKTSFSFEKSDDYDLSGSVAEPKPIKKYEPVFTMDVLYFEKSVIFQQKVKLKNKSANVVKGKLNFMVCNDHQCLPPENIDFNIPIK